MVKNKSKLRRTSGNRKKFSRKPSANTLGDLMEANPEDANNVRATKRFPRNNRGEGSKLGPSSDLAPDSQRGRRTPNLGSGRRFGSGPKDRKGGRNEDVQQHILLDGLPLTRDNMKNFLRIDRNRNINLGLKWRQGIGSVDMSPHTRGEDEGVPYWTDPFKEISNGESSSVNSLEFGGSNPSSEHSSDSTSLDDVCLPEYFEYHNKHPPAEQSYHWPDLRVLEEFINEELQEHGDFEDGKSEVHEDEPQAEQNEQNVYFQDPVAVSLNSKDSNNEYDKRFERMNTTEDTPLLDKALVNEVDVLKQRGQPLRLRPPTVAPWDRSGDKMPAILDKKERCNSRHRPSSHGARPGKVDGKLCRFTYFREDMDQTIHSPSLSGLLVGDSKNLNTEHNAVTRNDQTFIPKEKDAPSKDALEQKTRNSTLHDLFLPKYYSRKRFQVPNNHTNLNEIPNPNDSNPPPKLSSTSRQDLSESVATHENSRPDFNENVIHPFWLDVLDPSEEEMKVLSKTFRIHPLTTEDIFLGETREKVELFSSYYFVCFTSFDVVYERKKQRAKETEKKFHKIRELQEASGDDASLYGSPSISKFWHKLSKFWKKLPFTSATQIPHNARDTLTSISKNKKVRSGELLPLNMYMIIFKDAVITFHFSATPHPVNVRRRARLLRDYLNVSSDWICYALVDDITDSFAPMIESIEDEVNSIEDAILRMHSGNSDEDEDSDEDGKTSDNEDGRVGQKSNRDIFYRRQRSKSTVDHGERLGFPVASASGSRKSSRSISRSTKSSKVLGWKRKGDLLRRIGECRKRVMSVLRLLGSKADVIRGFSKRFSEPSETNTAKQTLAPSPEIGMYLGDIQDHVVTMVLSLNHYEKLLARSHSNYLAQINIDMTKVNNDTNDVLGKLTILGTIVLPLNVVTGLWGMNCLVPGQDRDDLSWFFSIVFSLTLFSAITYFYLERVLSLRTA